MDNNQLPLSKPMKREMRDWIKEKLADYLDDPEQTYCHVDIYFGKGREHQSKHRTIGKSEYINTPPVSKYRLESLNTVTCPKCEANAYHRSEVNGQMVRNIYCYSCGEKLPEADIMCFGIQLNDEKEGD